MKRIKLIHGTARVEDSISEETITALNNLSEHVYNFKGEACSNCKKQLTNMDFRFGKKSKPKLCVTCYTCNG